MLRVSHFLQFLATNVFLYFSRIMHMTEPATDLVATCLRCYGAVVKMNPADNAKRIVTELSRLRFFPTVEKAAFTLTSGAHQMQPGIFGSLVMEVSGKCRRFCSALVFCDVLASYAAH